MRESGSPGNQVASSRTGEPNASSNNGYATSQAPAINLPKGGGAVRSIGEKFAANPVTGTGSMSVPIATSPGRAGFGPQLALSYDSGAGNGSFGFGWSLSLPSVSRKTDKGLPQYFDRAESDVFVLSGAEDLVPVFKKNPDGSWVLDQNDNPVVDDNDHDGFTVRPYRPRIEGLFARIERWTRNADGDVHWRSISRDNILTVYGKDNKSRIADPLDSLHIFSWLICETRDDKGNAVLYDYKPEDGVGVELTQAHERNRGDRTDPRRTSNRYLKHIYYGNRVPVLDNAGQRPPLLTDAQIQNAGWMFEVVFDYGEHDDGAPKPGDAGPWTYRADPFSSYRAGFEMRTYRLCQRVLMFHHFDGEAGVGNDCLVRSTDFTYSQEQNPADARNPIYSFLLSVAQSGYKRNNGGYLKRSLPSVEYQYTQPIVQDRVHDVDAASLENLPIGVDGTAYQWTDLHGEGIPGILSEQAGAWFYKRNISPISARPVEFAPLERVASKPNLNLAGGQAQFMDLAGDGLPDLVMLDGPVTGLYEHDGAESWQPFRSFIARLNRDTRDPNLKFVDLDGDGHADVLISEDEALVWHPSLEEDGFGPARRIAKPLDEEKGPRLVFVDGTQSIYLADMCGDGLTDLVRIRDGEVCYWPNLGYGRFGSKVTMDNAPHFDTPDQFDHQRIRLADIDGTGTTDIIYLHRDGVRLYFNQSGNSWSAPQPLRVFPRVDYLAAIAPADLLGNGTACLVWSSALPGDARHHMRFVDLMGGQKPHLLVKTVNNLGAETHVAYTPSTKFYLQDKRDGKPWITRLPFPVHVVERVETFDVISRNRFVTRYAYHHGYFDGVEREFRGFGMVEQFDTESFATLSAGESLTSDNIDAASHVPPVHTKTWFHTGVYLGRDHISNYFAGLLDAHDRGEYYREPAWRDDDDVSRQFLLADTVLPAGLSVAEAREACRALKGAMLRQEVYALDGTAKAHHPYTITEQNFTIEQLQPQAAQRHGVFFSHAREAISYHYERNPVDPRISHALTLAVDGFGNVLQEAAIGYGRRTTIQVVDAQGNTTEIPNPDLNQLNLQDRAKQTQTLITYTENRLSNAIDLTDDYRTPLPCETLTYELTGLASAGRFTFDALLLAGTSAAPIAYEQSPTQGALQKRLIEHVRSLYRPNDMGAAQNDSLALLPLGTVESLALPGESYKLALTPGLAAGVYGGRVSDAMLESEGRYVHSAGDANWWIPSGRVFFSPNSADTAAAELDNARRHFFLPQRYRDPFHTNAVSTENFVSYDRFNLLMVETRDPLGNRVTAATADDTGNTAIRIDYRVLQPYWVTDPNGNRAQVMFDILGMVAGTAVMGKPLPAPVEGDSLALFEADLSQAQIDEFFDLADPHAPAPALLKAATTRIIYDLDRFQRTRQAHPEDPTQWLPACAATLARETHAGDPLPPQGLKIQLSFAYSDGFGREIQKKIQAEPGPLVAGGPDVDPRWVGSGWTIFNNKGKPVRQYEPFFSDTHHFEFGVQVGVSPILFYDPVERAVATLHPNHTWEKVVFDPWQQTIYDVSDTVLAEPKSDADVGDFLRRLPDADYLPTWHAQRQGGALGPQEQVAAGKAAAHADTPTVAYLDTLGRPFLTFADNGPDPMQPQQHLLFATRVELDIEGDQRAVSDAKDRVVMRYDHDMLGNQIHQASMEAGERWMLNDVAGQPSRAWDSRDHQFRTTYDQLRRPTDSFMQEGTEPARLIGHTVYGETLPNPAAKNLRGKAIQLFDQAGVVTSDDYDFKGNLRSGQRQLAQEYKTILDWATNPPLEDDIFTSRTSYDALNRPTELTAPHTTSMQSNVIRPIFNEANLLERVEANLRGAAVATPFVTDIDYDAKGQRTLIDYGNGVRTTYDYDPLTFRLMHLQTLRGAEPLQDLHYTYDPAGNITHIGDAAQQTIYFDGQVVAPLCAYTYDAIYRLINATGREHIGQASRPETTWNDEFRVKLQHPQNGQALRNYTETYEYDAVGNFEKLIHQAANGDWTRTYAYNEASLLEPGKPSNRLSSTTVGGNNPVTEPYTYDAHGNMTRMNHLPLMQWDERDQLQATSQQVRTDGGTPETTYYVYDAGGQRVRKVTEHQAAAGQTPTRMKERIYLGGFEIYREYNGNGATVTLQRETLHIMDDQQRIALVETRTDTPAPEQLIRYQFGNHLGSTSLELDAVGQIISYEEYYPYGSTSYQAGRNVAEVMLKRYRYTGLERDEESGFSYHGARYYAPWLGRWTSSDPAGLTGDPNSYAYGMNHPVNFLDPKGTQSEKPDSFTNTVVRRPIATGGSGQRKPIAAGGSGQRKPIATGGSNTGRWVSESKQAIWAREFRRDYPQFEGVGNVAGTRDAGILTETGVRVPLYGDHLLGSRPFYERREAAFLAYQGFIHYAELVEARHDAAATTIALALLERTGRQVPNDTELDLYGYTGWSRRAVEARQGVELSLALASVAMVFHELSLAARAAPPKPVPGPPAPKPTAQSALGDLTAEEISQIQAVVDKAGRPLEVAGSAAQGTRRGVGTRLPIGKDPPGALGTTRSDIDYLVPPSSHPYYKGLEGQLPSIDPGGIIPGTHNPHIGPAIRFEPGAAPRYVPGKN
jgi:RHS repeat-associated protein